MAAIGAGGMENMTRYAIYYAPEAGPFADAAAAWLGWDLARGCAVRHPSAGFDLAQITQDARKYGFHGTIKPPFRLAAGVTAQDLAQGLGKLASSLAPVRMEGLDIVDLQGFLALCPMGDGAALADLGAEVVRALDAYRAPLTPAEIARRRPETLTDRQRDLLAIYGYPFVMEEFQFHLTLTDRLDAAAMPAAHTAAVAHFSAVLPRPFVLGDLCLCGQDAAGLFHLLHRYPLMA